jgi:FkbM family methyltransferase
MDSTTPSAPARPATLLKPCRHGRMLFLPHDRYIGRSLDIYGEFSEQEGRVFAQLVHPRQVVVEIGAHVGSHTLHLARLVGPNGLVAAFEPQRFIFYLLCANLALNEHFHVRAYHAALGEAAGSIKVPQLDYRIAENFGGVPLRQGVPAAGEDVPLATLDQFDFPALRLLKIDVEGMEGAVLRGARRTIARHRPILYVENDREAGSPELIGLIQSFGYALFWHLPPLFNPENFAGSGDNIFPGIISINLLCLPSEMAVPVVGARRVTGPEDWWSRPG